MPSKEPLLGYLIGTGDDVGARVAVHKAGRTYRLSYGGRKHLCHPSITSVELCKREAFHVFLVHTEGFEPL